MKRVFLLCMVLCCLGAANAQGRGEWSEEEMLEMLENKVQDFCRYVKIIGTTKSGFSEQYKESLKEDSIWTLFYRYDERSMLTTRGWDGKVIKKSSMRDYFEALHDQAKAKFRNDEIRYDLKFQFVTSGGNLKWVYKKTNADGTKEYTATVRISQIYIKERRNGSNEIIHRRKEEDKKEMECTKIVYPNNEVLVALRDITKAERVKTTTSN